MDVAKIAQLIEELREELQRLAAHQGMLNEEVLHKSRELDKLLNDYYRLLYKEKSNEK